MKTTRRSKGEMLVVIGQELGSLESVLKIENGLTFWGI
jgi:hypothetical protein